MNRVHTLAVLSLVGVTLSAHALADTDATSVHEDINYVDMNYLDYLNQMEALGYLGYLEELGYYVPDPLPAVGIQPVGTYPSYLESLVGLGYIYSVDRADTSFYFGGNGTSHLQVNFTTCDINGDMDFRIGTDAGNGLEAYVDGMRVHGAYDDIWWNFDWNDPDVQTFTLSLDEGTHTLDIYTVESCCGGGSVLEYRHDWTDWTPFVSGASTCPADADDDGIPDSEDNCPSDANDTQADADNDGIGDACEADTDGDGVTDDYDQCADSPDGAVVNNDGCTIDQINPCEGTWKNHGAYVSATTATAQAFRTAGLISQAEYATIVSQAAKSGCGR